MKPIYLVAAFAVSASAFAYQPAEQRDFGEFAASGCQNRDGDFIIRGIVSSASEDTLVLSDPLDSSSTMSVTIPGRGPFARASGVFGTSKREASDKLLHELRSSHTAVVVTLKCKGDATPMAREISYQNLDGTNAAISF